MSKRLPSPKTKGVANVPVIMQMENMECGAASLAMILAYYRKWVPLSTLRDTCGISRDGAKMSSIARAARIMGLEAQGYRYEPEDFFREATFPCVVHWRFTHFVVVCGRRGKHVYLNDPAGGSYKVTMEEFDEAFTGVCLCFCPGESFEPSGKNRSMFSYLRANLKGAGSTVAFVAVSTLIVSLCGLLLPFASRVFIDRILTDKNPEWILPLLIFLIIICLIQLVVGWAQAVYQIKLFGTLGVKASTRYMWHIFHMPARFFFQRQPGDLQQNEEANRVISETFILRIVPLLIGSIMMVFYAIAMFRYSLILSAVGLSIVVVNLFLSRYIANRRINIVRVMKRDMGKLYSSTMAGIGMLETIKAAGAENSYFARWAGYQANVNDQNVRFERTTQILGSIPGILIKIASVLLLCGGVWLILRGQFTQGCVLAFQSYLTAFMDPALQMINSQQMIQEMRTDMERIEDVMQYPESTILKKDEPGDTFRRLQGDIELKHVTFGYSSLEPPLVKDLSFHVEAGKSVAIVGRSGCGKSTILSLVAGLYKPWEGEVCFDGTPLDQIPAASFRNSVSVIEQKSVLFKDTIANNIKMWDESIADFEMIMAAKDAQIHDDIMQRSSGYQHMLLEGGADLSGGQRQRLEIARGLAADPTIIIMDEATSALDAATEYHVVNSIHKRGITCLVVAHRLSTVRDCDEIIVLEQGAIAERGTHEELMARNGLYSSLVKNN